MAMKGWTFSGARTTFILKQGADDGLPGAAAG
jgi:hypothetical protein